MVKLYDVRVLKGHIQFLAKTYNLSNVQKKGNVAWKLAISQVRPLFLSF